MGLPALAILAATLVPGGGQVGVEAWHCFRCGERYSVDALLNVALFVPLGLGLVASGVAPLRAVCWSLGLSLVVELAQLALPGRNPSPWDVLTNAAGAALGSALYGIRDWSRGPRVGVVGAALVVSFLHFPLIAALMVPAPSPSTSYVGLIGHVFAGDVPFPGQVLDSRFDGEPVQYAELSYRDAIVDAFESGRFELETLVDGTERVRGHALIVGLADGGQYLLDTAQEGCRFLFRVRMRAKEYGFSYPGVAVDYPCEEMALPLRLTASADPRRLRYAVEGPVTRAEETLELSGALGWAALLPGAPSFANGGFITLVWLGALSGALAWLWAFTLGNTWAFAVVPVVLASGHAAAALWAGGEYPGIAAIVALGLGAALGVSATPRRRRARVLII